MRDLTFRTDDENATAFIPGLDARTMTRYGTDNEPEPSPGITRAASILAQRKRAGVPFETAWENAMGDTAASDRRALTWAREALQDAYENRSGGPLASAAVDL